MPAYLTPGVYVEEMFGTAEPGAIWTPSDHPTSEERNPIRLVGAGAAAFIGVTERIPVGSDGVFSLTGRPVLVESWEQYVERFGDRVDGAHLPAAVHGFFANGGSHSYIISLGTLGSGGEIPALTRSHFEGDYERRTGMAALAAVPDLTLLCAPDLMAYAQRGILRADDVVAVQERMIAISESRGSCIALLDTPPGLTADAAYRWRRDADFDRDHAAVYFPWIRVGANPHTAVVVPPCGHVAGALMRIHGARGPHATAANEVLADVIDLEMAMAPGEQDVLHPLGVNVLRLFPDGTIRIWGSRTLASDPALRALHDRVLVHTIARSIEQGATWAIFQRVDTVLRERIYRELYAFLDGLWRIGALAGESAREAFYVTQAEADRDGPLAVHLGFAMHRAGEFTQLRIVFASEPTTVVRRVETAPLPPEATLPGAEIFVSYGREDWSEFVEPLVATLREAGFDVWVDQHLLRGGHDWMDAINDALARCPVMVLCLSPDAVASKYVKLEYRYFFNESKPILPVMCRPTVLPAEVRGLQYVPYSEREQWIAHLTEMVSALRGT